MDFVIERDPGLRDLVTFVPNKRLPVYNWFYYKEGFARDLVFHYFRKWGVPGRGERDMLIDPFSGSGTSLLAAKEAGIAAAGLDVHPVALLASRVKTRNWDRARLSEILSMLGRKTFERPDGRELKAFPFRRYFPSRGVEDILFLSSIISGMESPYREFFGLALITSAYRCSWMYKDGAVLKVVKKPVPPLRKYFFRLAKRMVKESGLISGHEPVVLGKDARELERVCRSMGWEETFSISVTSPPYLNKIEYQKVYSLEEWILERIGWNEGNGHMLRSYIFGGERGMERDGTVEKYFRDIRRVLEGLHVAMKPGGRVAWVVAGGVFPDRIVESDTITAEIAEDVGFSVDRIVEARRRVATRRRTIKIGEARESVIEMVRTE